MQDGKISGMILLSLARLTVVAKCSLDLAYFPMDSQMCELEMMSYGYNNKELLMRWIDNEVAFEVAPDIGLSQFKLYKVSQVETNVSYVSGDFTALLCQFYLDRDIVFYLLSNYFPCVMIVFISWVSFWITRSSTPARAGLGVTTVLSMLTLILAAAWRSPKVSYVKASDVYFCVCFLYVFAALVEFSAVCYFDNAALQAKEKAKLSPKTDEEVSLNPAKVEIRTSTFAPSRIDHCSRGLFPLTFLVFNIVYWVTYSTMAKMAAARAAHETH